MWGYIFYGFIITYYVTFCVAISYDMCQEYQEEQRQRRLEYEQISNQDPGIEMYLESEYANRQNNRLPPITEEIEGEKVFENV